MLFMIGYNIVCIFGSYFLIIRSVKITLQSTLHEWLDCLNNASGHVCTSLESLSYSS